MQRNTQDYIYFFNVLKESRYFKELTDEILHEFLSAFYVETWSKGQQTFHGDKTFYKFYYIVKGRIKMYQVNPNNGNEFTLYMNSPGDFFDIICLLDGKRHDIEMETLDEMLLLAAPIDVVREWMQKHPEFNKIFLPYIADKFRRMEEKAYDLALFDTWTRMLKLFIKHTHQNIHHTELKLINNLSNKEIARIIGTSKNVVNRHMQKLKDEDIIYTKRNHIEIKNLHKLMQELKK